MYKTYGEALDAAIQIKDNEEDSYTQSDLAKGINTQPGQVNRWINKGITPVKRTQRAIENEIGFNITHKDGGWVISKQSSQSNDPKVQYAGSVDLPEDGQLSKDQIKQLLGQIESIARILKDSL